MGSPDEAPVSSRERRLAEALIAVTVNQVVSASYSATIAEARAVLASPEADPKAWVEVVAPVIRFPAGHAGCWRAKLRFGAEHGVELRASSCEEPVRASAEAWAAALGLPVREPKP